MITGPPPKFHAIRDILDYPPDGPITQPRSTEWGNDTPEGPALRRSAVLERVGKDRGVPA
jgi:hypothetical protein